jgi:hypothetical protein
VRGILPMTTLAGFNLPEDAETSFMQFILGCVRRVSTMSGQAGDPVI